MNLHEKINYIEFPASNIKATKAFFADAFDWSFEDYGPEYARRSRTRRELPRRISFCRSV